MRLPALGEDGDARLARTVSFTFIAAVAILALYFGSEVLIPVAVAVLFAFILNPLVSGLRRLLPLPLAVGLAMLGAMACIAVLAVLVTSQLAEVAGSLAGYQTNLHEKIQDVRQLSNGAGPVSRFIAMTASLAQDLSPEAGPAGPPLRVQPGESNLASIATFVAPLVHPLLSVGIVIVLALFILLDRDQLSDKFVRLFGADVHATSQAVGDAAARIARMLSLQLLTNIGFAALVGTGLFALGMPNALLWGLLAGAFRFVPYVGAILGALLPTLIALAVMPGWLQPLLVLGLIVGLDILIGQLVEPLLFGESTGITPLALILSAIFWGMLWGPIGLLLSTPLTICLLVLGTHVPNLQFLRVLLGDEPALAPYQQIYRRLIRGAVVDAAAVAQKEIDDKGLERGLDDLARPHGRPGRPRPRPAPADREGDRHHRRRHRRGARPPRREDRRGHRAGAEEGCRRARAGRALRAGPLHRRAWRGRRCRRRRDRLQPAPARAQGRRQPAGAAGRGVAAQGAGAAGGVLLLPSLAGGAALQHAQAARRRRSHPARGHRLRRPLHGRPRGQGRTGRRPGRRRHRDHLPLHAATVDRRCRSYGRVGRLAADKTIG